MRYNRSQQCLRNVEDKGFTYSTRRVPLGRSSNIMLGEHFLSLEFGRHVSMVSLHYSIFSITLLPIAEHHSVPLNICFYQAHSIACSHNLLIKVYTRFHEILSARRTYPLHWKHEAKHQLKAEFSRTESDIPGQSIVFDNSFDRRSCPLKIPSGPEFDSKDKDGSLGATRFGNPSDTTEHITCSYTLLDSVGRGGKGLSFNKGPLACFLLPWRRGRARSLAFFCQVNIFGSLLSAGLGGLLDRSRARFVLWVLSERRVSGTDTGIVSPGSKRS